MKKKFNTKLFSEGAEFLVLSKLLLARIETYKAYENQEGYDLIAINAKKNLSAKIQVKSKNFKGDSSFYLNKDYKTKSDFYVFAQTNSLTRDYKVIPDSESRPNLFVLERITIPDLSISLLSVVFLITRIFLLGFDEIVTLCQAGGITKLL